MIGYFAIGAVILLLLIIVGVYFSYYNRIRVLENRIEEAWSQIDVQLKKRFDLVPNLVNTVKGYADHEREIMEELGIKVQAEDLFLTVDHEYNTKKISLHVFNCATVSGKPKALQGQEIMWINPVELSELSFPPPDREIIRRLQSSDKNITQEE